MAKKQMKKSVKRKVAPAMEGSDRNVSFNRSGSGENWFQDLISNPALRYVAGGLATAVITRLANNISEKYPEISNFLRENLHMMENKFGGGMQDGFDRDEGRVSNGRA